MPINIFLCFFLILTNAGGEGKTTLTLLIRAILDLALVDSYALDADQGTWALKNRYDQCLETQTMSWFPKADAAEKIVTRSARKPVLMDTGANMLASLSPVADLVFELQRRFSSVGYRTVALMPLSPNKSGAAEGINLLSDKVSDYEKYIVLNHRDQSGNFGKVRNDLPYLTVGHLASGFQAYLGERQWHIADVVLHPEPGFAKASGHVGQWVRQFALDPVVRNLLTPELCDLAISRLPPAPPPTHFAVATIAQATDEMLTINEWMSLVLADIDEQGWSPEGLRAAADALEAREAKVI